MNIWQKWQLIAPVLAGLILAPAEMSQPVFAQDYGSLRLTRAPIAPPYVRTDTGIPEINRKVLDFALGQMGRQVGNGECWTLAAEALKVAGAQRPNGYVFGRLLASSETALPGDIIQFTNCRFEERSAWRTRWIVAPHHTAIIFSVDQGQAVVVQQNADNIRRVQKTNMNLSSLVSGSYKIYRPLSNNMTPTAIPTNVVQNAYGASSIYALLRKPTVPGPMYQERADILDRIQKLQAKGVNVFFYLKRYQDIEMIAGSSANLPAEAVDNNLPLTVGTLSQLLTAREMLMTRAMEYRRQ